MEAQVEQLGGDRVRLTVEVPAEDVHHAVEHATSDLAARVKVPGFRAGKVPVPVLISRVGKERVYSEAVESHIGGWFWDAAAQSRVQPVESPEYDYELPESDDEAWRFTAEFPVQPKAEPADWRTLEVPRLEVEIPPEAIQAQLEELQRTVAEVVPVDGRAAQPGDVAVIDVVSDEGAQRDLVVELGAERVLDEIEEGIVGLGAGQSREVGYELADGSQHAATVVGEGGPREGAAAARRRARARSPPSSRRSTSSAPTSRAASASSSTRRSTAASAPPRSTSSCARARSSRAGSSSRPGRATS